MEKTYKQHLEEELAKAEKEFEDAKKAAAEEISNMEWHVAVDYGAAYASHIEKVTKAAVKAQTIGQMLNEYKWYMEHSDQ